MGNTEAATLLSERCVLWRGCVVLIEMKIKCLSVVLALFVRFNSRLDYL